MLSLKRARSSMQPLDFDPRHRAARNQGLMRCYSSSKLREAPLAASFIAVPLYDNLTEDLYHQNALRLIAAAATRMTLLRAA